MALDKKAVHTAHTILLSVFPGCGSFVQEHDDKDEFCLNRVIGYERKFDDGWENIFINVENITEDQLRMFNELKDKVPNSSFITNHPGGITQLGWF